VKEVNKIDDTRSGHPGTKGEMGSTISNGKTQKSRLPKSKDQNRRLKRKYVWEWGVM